MTPRKRQRGVAAVEFGILIIPLTLMLFGLTEYGRAVYQYNTLVKTTRDATRYLSTLAPGSGLVEAECLALYGKQTASCPDYDPNNPDPNFVPLVPGLTKGMVSICDASTPACVSTHALVSTGNGAVNLVTVTISDFEFKSLINFPVGGLSVGAPNITFGDISNTMRQAL